MPIPQYNSSVNPQYVTNIAPANPPAINDYTGQALNQVGGAVGGLGGQFAGTIIDQENQQDHLNAQIWASNAYSQAVLDWNQDLNNRKVNLTGPGTGFANQFDSDFNDYQNELLQNTPNEKTKQILGDQLGGLRTRLVTDAQDYQQKTFADYSVNQINQTIDNHAKASAASQGATAENSINSLTPIINALPVPQDKKFSLMDSAHSQIFDATIGTMIMNNPAQAQQYIMPAVGKQTGINAQIVTAAQQNNISPLTALALMGSESKLSPTAQNPNPNSTAKGLLQFTDKTWKDYGGTDENRNDPNTQIQLGMKYINDQQNYLRATLGRDPTAGELKAGIMFRYNAPAIINADPNTPISSIIGDKTAQLNNMQNKTTGQVLQSFNNLMSQQVKQFSNSDNYLVQTATAPQLFSAANKIQEAMNKQLKVQKFGFEQSVNNQIAMANNGQYNQITAPFDANTFNHYYQNPAEAAAKYDDYVNQMQIGNYKSQLVNMTPAQAQSTYYSLAPTPNSYDYADKYKLQQQFATARTELNTAIQNDGVGYLNNADPYIKSLNQQLEQNPNDPMLKGQYYSTVIAAQERQNVINPKILSQADENNLIASFKNLNGQQRADVITQQANNVGTTFWPYLARQLQNNKDAPEGMASIISAPDSSKETAAVLSTQNIQNIQKSLPTGNQPGSSSDINKAIQTALQPYDQSLSINQTGSKSIEDVRNTITKLAMNKVINGMSSTNAAQSAYDMFLGKDKYNYVNNVLPSTTIRIPKGIDTNAISGATRSIVNNLNINNVDTSNANLLKNPWTMNSNIDGYLDQIKSNARWITTDNDQGAQLWFRAYNNIDYPVLGKDKQPITKSWSELNNLYNTVPDARETNMHNWRINARPIYTNS